MKKSNKDIIVIGFALFAMFFGAGNLIFPSFLGNAFGDKYLIGIIGFICTGVGLPLLAILATTKGDGTFETMASKISPKFAVIFSTILFIDQCLQFLELLQQHMNLLLHQFFLVWNQ